jgi:hypothetical protein
MKEVGGEKFQLTPVGDCAVVLELHGFFIVQLFAGRGPSFDFRFHHLRDDLDGGGVSLPGLNRGCGSVKLVDGQARLR